MSARGRHTGRTALICYLNRFFASGSYVTRVSYRPRYPKVLSIPLRLWPGKA
jgi:hypothetical protein